MRERTLVYCVTKLVPTELHLQRWHRLVFPGATGLWRDKIERVQQSPDNFMVVDDVIILRWYTAGYVWPAACRRECQQETRLTRCRHRSRISRRASTVKNPACIAIEFHRETGRDYKFVPLASDRENVTAGRSRCAVEHHWIRRSNPRRLFWKLSADHPPRASGDFLRERP